MNASTGVSGPGASGDQTNAGGAVALTPCFRHPASTAFSTRTGSDHRAVEQCIKHFYIAFTRHTTKLFYTMGFKGVNNKFAPSFNTHGHKDSFFCVTGVGWFLVGLYKSR
jgi:hypothetical protein